MHPLKLQLTLLVEELAALLLPGLVAWLMAWP